MKSALTDDYLRTLPAPTKTMGSGRVILGAVGMCELNLPDSPFPGWSTRESRRYVADRLLDALCNAGRYRWSLVAEMCDLSEDDRRLLLEREQISSAMAARSDGVYVLSDETQHSLAFINDEEHLAFFTFCTGGAESIPTAFHCAAENRDKLAALLSPAFNSKGGYLYSDPAKTGEGVYVSTLVHLPGLMLTGELEHVRNALEELEFVTFPAMNQPRSATFWICSTSLPYGELDGFLSRSMDALTGLHDSEMRSRNMMTASPAAESCYCERLTALFNSTGKRDRLSYRDTLHVLSQLRLALALHRVTTKVPEQEAEELIARTYMDCAPVHMMRLLGQTDKEGRRRRRSKIVRDILRTRLRIRPCFSYENCYD